MCKIAEMKVATALMACSTHSTIPPNIIQMKIMYFRFTVIHSFFHSFNSIFIYFFEAAATQPTQLIHDSMLACTINYLPWSFRTPTQRTQFANHYSVSDRIVGDASLLLLLLLLLLFRFGLFVKYFA